MVAQSTALCRPTLLLSRPKEAGARFADAVRARFGAAFDIVLSPVLAPEFLFPELPQGVRGVIFTSATGVAAYARLTADRGLPAWCVGARTAEVARTVGFIARALGGDAATLAAALIDLRPPAPLLHARGREAAGDLAARLTAAGVMTVEAVVYAQVAVPLTPAAQAALQGADPVIVPLFSPRSAQLFATAAFAATLEGPRAPLWIAAMSDAVAAACAPLSPSRLAVAPVPDEAGMLAAITGLNAASA